MKKILIALTIAISFLGIRSVSADNIVLVDVTQENFTQYKQLIGNDNFNTIVNDVLNEYKNKYILSYPYFYISFDLYYDYLDDVLIPFLKISLFYFKDIPKGTISYGIQGGNIGLIDVSFLGPFGYIDIDGDGYKDYTNYISRKYPLLKEDNLIFDINNYSSAPFTYPAIASIKIDSNYYSPYAYYISNFDLYFPSIKKSLNDRGISSGFIFDYDNIEIPKLGEEHINRVISLETEDLFFEPYYLYDSDVDVSIPNIEEINLNDYAYVALALKDYNKKAFETTIQVKGQYCLTPVYNYGMTERKDILEGTQVDRCSPYYDNYTPIRTYILDNDLKNNAIYYLKSYDSTKDNYVKVDTSVFDITYVTEENKDNPYVTIGGKTYPTIPYDNLTDTATKSEDEGYVSGAVKGFSFSDIFTAPMEFLEDIWDSIVSVFDLVKEFFSLLPEPIPTFLLSSFLLGLAIGLLKLIF